MSLEPPPGRWVAEYRTPVGTGWIAGRGGSIDEMGLPGKPIPRDGRVMGSGDVPDGAATMVNELEAYFAGGPLPDVPDEMIRAAATTEFLRRVYESVAAIPAGETRTYAAIAAEAGRPGASRAVGAAMARNPFAPVIPCHRVVGSDGSLRGYGGGLGMKQALLEMEAVGG